MSNEENIINDNNSLQNINVWEEQNDEGSIDNEHVIILTSEIIAENKMRDAIIQRENALEDTYEIGELHKPSEFILAIDEIKNKQDDSVVELFRSDKLIPEETDAALTASEPDEQLKIYKKVHYNSEKLQELEEDFSSSSLTLTEECSYEETLGFLDTFGDALHWQDFENISSSELIVEEVEEEEENESMPDLLQHSSTLKYEEENELKQQEADKDMLHEEMQYDDESLDLPKSEEDLHAAAVDDDDDNILQALMGPPIPQPVVVEFEDFDWNLYEKEQAKIEIENHIQIYLNKLINEAVDKYEKTMARQYLENRFDKLSLMTDLFEALAHLAVEERAKPFLIKKMAIYFKRKKKFRCLCSNNELLEDKAGKMLLTEVLEQMQILLNKEKDTEDKIDNALDDAQRELKKIKTVAKYEENKLNDLFNEVFLKNRKNLSSTYVAFIEHKLNCILKLRYEISEVRALYIQRQHYVKLLNEQFENLEHMGNGLLIQNYQVLSTNIINISKTVEEVDANVQKFQNRSNGCILALAHVRERQIIIRKSIESRNEILNNFIIEYKALKDRYVQLKLKQKEIRNKIEELGFQCGLLSKPLLMFDYDETVEKCRKLEQEILMKRKRLGLLETHIESIEKTYINQLSKIKI